MCRFHISFLRRLTSHYSGPLFVVVYKACRWPVGPDALLSIVRSAHEISDKNPDGLQNTCERVFSTEVECVVYPTSYGNGCGLPMCSLVKSNLASIGTVLPLLSNQDGFPTYGVPWPDMGPKGLFHCQSALLTGLKSSFI